MTYRAPKGTDDILPPASPSGCWRSASSSTSQSGTATASSSRPLFESTDLFSRGIGEDTEVVEKQMYTFTDKGGRSVTLRPEGDRIVVRAVIQAGGVIGTFKGCDSGPMFRYERPQKGTAAPVLAGRYRVSRRGSPPAPTSRSSSSASDSSRTLVCGTSKCTSTALETGTTELSTGPN